MIETIQFKLNDRPVSLKTDSERTFLRVLRTDLGVTGPKYGCGDLRFPFDTLFRRISSWGGMRGERRP
jgi:aerobic-type carbon monoxide dehydrogenase small subunit (CoxS/CutS family)